MSSQHIELECVRLGRLFPLSLTSDRNRLLRLFQDRSTYQFQSRCRTQHWVLRCLFGIYVRRIASSLQPLKLNSIGIIWTADYSIQFFESNSRRKFTFVICWPGSSV